MDELFASDRPLIFDGVVSPSNCNFPFLCSVSLFILSDQKSGQSEPQKQEESKQASNNPSPKRTK